MTKRRLAWIALAVVAALVVAGIVWSAFGPTTIVLTAPQLQERVNRALPREFKGVTVERATVTIAERRIALRVEARASALGHSLSTVVSARGVPRYEPAEGEIFFDPEDRGYRARRRRLGGAVEHAARRAPAKHPQRGRDRDDRLSRRAPDLPLQGRSQGDRCQSRARRHRHAAGCHRGHVIGGEIERDDRHRSRGAPRDRVSCGPARASSALGGGRQERSEER